MKTLDRINPLQSKLSACKMIFFLIPQDIALG
jgi:hypothetical protein